MQIGKLKVANRVVLAPMAGVTDQAFRTIVKRLGCGLMFTEMISAKGIVYDNVRTKELLAFGEGERPMGVQIFGSDPAIMAEAARIVTSDPRVDLIDINMGCPTPKIVRNGDGAALMRQPALAGEIIRSVAEAVTVPVAVKIRKGWDEGHVNAVEIARIAEQAGAAAVTVHGRTRSQFYAGQADWQIIKEVKYQVGIPVIGNGDVRTPEDARRMLEETGCDGIMVGRACLGNPWLPGQIAYYLETGRQLPVPSPAERIAMALEHLALLIQLKGEQRGVREMRMHAAWYIKGCRNATSFRAKFNRAKTQDEFVELLQEYLTVLQQEGDGEN